MVRQKKFQKQFLLGCFMTVYFSSATAQVGNLDSFYKKGGKLYATKVEYVSSFVSGKDVRIYSLRGGYGTFLFKKLAIFGLLDISGTKGFCTVNIDNDEQLLNAESVGLGASFLARWHVVQIGKVGLFLDAGAGILYTFQSFPPNGTKLNFTARPGAGLTLDLTKNLQLMGGANRFHLSNGQGYKHTYNPALDGLGIFVGVVLRNK